MVGRKQRFIDQAFSGDKSLRSMDDLGEASLFRAGRGGGVWRSKALQRRTPADVEQFEQPGGSRKRANQHPRSALAKQNGWQVRQPKKDFRYSKLSGHRLNGTFAFRAEG